MSCFTNILLFFSVSQHLNIMDLTYIMGTHRAPCGSYMRRELYAALHYNLHIIDFKVLMPELKEDDAETSASPSFSSREGGGGEPQEEFASDHGFLEEVEYLWERLMLSLLFGRQTCPQMWP